MAFPHSHKTVIVLDRSPFFLSSSNEFVEFDVFAKSRAPGMIPLAPIAKTLWTCNVEAAVEYARIVYDVNPYDKLISLIASDSEATQLNTWASQEQNLQQMLSMLAHLGPPSLSTDQDDCSILQGLTKAIEMLTTPTHIQSDILKVEEEVVNNGRIICMTAFKSDTQSRRLEECFQDALNEHNKLAEGHASLLPVDDCELVMIHVVPVGHDSHVAYSLPKRISECLSSELHISQSGHFVAATMVGLTIQHYGMASTTVTGIPMKEEQNASSSANYDVELLHAAEAHHDKPAGTYETVTLKWCTPKSTVTELQQCSGAYRISPVDVNSRPSSCLTNFLLNGRSVMLEQPKKSGTRVMSHMLTSHGGEIYIHTLSSNRSILEDPPSISEGSGGRVTDYRINDFGELMKDCRLAPSGDSQTDPTPIERAKKQIERMTRHWPMVIGDTIVFNIMSHIEPLPSLIVKERMDEEEVLECKKAIYHVVGMESRNEALPIPPSGSRGKGPKREEQYRQMWNELEHLIRAHANTSPNHQKILECLTDCRKPQEGVKKPSEKTTVKEEKPEAMEVEESFKDFDRYQKLTEREKQELNKVDIKPPSSPPSKRLKLGLEQAVSKGGAQKSLLSLWTTKIKSLHSARHEEFAGRTESTGNQAELYIHMKQEKNGDTADVKPPSLLSLKTSLKTSIKK